MELVYIYLKHCSPFTEEQHIQLDPTKHYEYVEENQKINCFEKKSSLLLDDRVNGFSSMTAIVGKNGVGKTHLLNLISNKIAYHIAQFSSNTESTYFLLFKIDSDNFLLLNQNGEGTFWEKKEKDVCLILKQNGKKFDTFQPQLLIAFLHKENQPFLRNEYSLIQNGNSLSSTILYTPFTKSPNNISETIFFLDDWLQIPASEKDLFKEDQYTVKLFS